MPKEKRHGCNRAAGSIKIQVYKYRIRVQVPWVCINSRKIAFRYLETCVKHVLGMLSRAAYII